jgi:HPr kinase/phosphorylase
MDSNPPVLHVDTVLEERSLRLELLAGGEGLSRRVQVPEVQKPGLALAGHVESLHPERIQVMGFSEMSYLETLDPEVATLRFQTLCDTEVPCLVVTRRLEVPEYLVEICRRRALPLLRTSLDSATFLGRLKPFLSGRLNPTVSTHGVLVDVYGVGILLLGKSGIGKSEMALDLVLRGHRLVADDIVEMQRRSSKVLVGQGPEIIKHHMEIRGLGILNIKDLFGIASVRDAKRVDLVIELVEWNEEEEYERLGVDDDTYVALDVEIPKIRLPVRQGRNMTAIIEVAARNQLLKVRGHHSARQFQDRLVRAISDSRSTLAKVDGEEE